MLKERPVSLIWNFDPNIACPVKPNTVCLGEKRNDGIIFGSVLCVDLHTSVHSTEVKYCRKRLSSSHNSREKNNNSSRGDDEEEQATDQGRYFFYLLILPLLHCQGVLEGGPRGAPAFSTNAHPRFESVVLGGVLGPLRPAPHT